VDALNLFSQALVRPPGASYANALAEQPQPIDVALAQKQHAEYVAALRETGVRVEILDAAEKFPDACFMQDPALVINGLAILNRMGAPSRVGETDLVADILRARFETHALTAPASLEGGDVLNCGDRLIVGVSARTNQEGIAQLRAVLEPRGIRVDATPVGNFLHLLTAVTYVGQGIIVVHEDFAAHPLLRAFDKVRVSRDEAYAANALGIGKYVILPAGFPNTAAQIRAKGFEVLQAPMSEFYKADGGVSCLSLLW
jgi:dimethylargininase